MKNNTQPSKLINVSVEISELDKQIKIINRLRYKLSSQMRHYKQFLKLRQIIVKTKALSQKLQLFSEYDAKDIDKFSLSAQIEECNNLKQLIQNEGNLVREFFSKAYLLQFSVISYGCCAKMHCLIDKMLRKLQIVDKIQTQRRQKKEVKAKKSEKAENKTQL